MSLSTASLSSTRAGQRGIWNSLTAPFAGMQEVERRRRARLLTALLMLLMVSLTIGGVTSLLNPNTRYETVGTFQLVGVAVLLPVYFLSRTRHYVIASAITTVALCAPSFVLLLIGAVPYNDLNIAASLNWLVIPVMLGSVWFSLVGMGVMSGLLIGAIALLPVFIPAITYPDLIGPFGTMGTVCALAMIAAGIRQQDVKQIEGQIRELNMLNLELQKSTVEAKTAMGMAREANRLKSQFLATMSHELRTPLNAMIGFAEIMIAGMGGVIDDDARHMIERIHANSKRLLELINDVLDLSKIEAQKIEIAAKAFSPRQFSEDLRSRMAGLAATKGLDFHILIDPALPTEITGDEALVNRIATNLLSNAFKFTDAGVVTLSLDCAGNEQWVMSVRDTGIGIAPHALGYIFDPFRQVDGSSRRAYGGTGLGLAIVRELARAMGGQVDVKSTVGEGSIFTVTLPLVTGEKS